MSRERKGERELRERKVEERENQEREECNFNGFNFQHQNNAKKNGNSKENPHGSSNRMQSQERVLKEKEVTMQFIFSHANLVDADILEGVIYNQDRNISLALIQIHERSLNSYQSHRQRSFSQEFGKKTYAEAAKKQP